MMQEHEEFVIPQRKSRTSTAYKPYVRKFPGPAGLAPDLTLGEVEKMLVQKNGLTGISNNAVLSSSKYSNLLLSKPCYLQFIQDFGLNKLNNPLNHISLEMVSKAFSRKAKRDLKVPFLGVLVSSISQEHGIALKLMDPTLEVNAVVSQELWDEIRDDLKLNSVLALTQVPVIASFTVRPPITLYITKKNIIYIYAEPNENETEVITFNRVPETELRRTCLEWLKEIGINAGSSTAEISSPPSSSSSSSSQGKLNVKTTEFSKDLNFATDDFAESEKNFNSKKARLESSEGEKEFFSRRKESIISKNPGDFNSNSNGKFTLKANDRIEELSQTEKLMVQEVLNGISFEDFEN